MCKKLFVMVLAIGLVTGVAQAALYTYDGVGDAAGSGTAFDALDGTWSHDNGADQWDGTPIGAERPGGVMSLTEGPDTFLRIQDTGDPRDYGMGDPGSNSKIYFAHDLGAHGVSDTFLNDGVTLEFRARISTGAPLDDQHPDGGGGILPWPANGDGYVIHDDGKGMIGLRQVSGDMNISFSLCHSAEVDGIPGFEGVQSDILVMNNLVNTTTSSGDVDTRDTSASILARNYLPIPDATLWHTFDINIAAGGPSTHLVAVSLDGAAPVVFEVTAGSGDDFDLNYMSMGQGTTPEMGAIDIDFFSYMPGQDVIRRIFVDADATGANNGLSWADAYNYLQDALTDAAVSGRDIWVAEGTYKPDRGGGQTPGDRTATFQLINDVDIYGGFPYGGGTWEQRDPSANETILSGIIGKIVPKKNNSYHVVTGSGTGATTILDGFTITGGKANGSGTDMVGGGMYNYAGSPTVTNCTFIGNSASNGGGMENENSSPTVTNCTFSGNSAEWDGGGMYNSGSSPTVTNCILWGNTAPGGAQIYGGGAYVSYSDVQGGWTGTGNIDADPLFIDDDGLDDVFGTEDDDLRLSPGSPCIDAGDNSSVPDDTVDLDEDGNTSERTPLDLGGNARFTDDPLTEDTGVPATGYPEIVEMGAYERYEFCGSEAYPYPPGDLSGPDGVRDCYVDFFDFAVFAAHWLEYTGPE